jgi:hypothetical protein
MGTRLGLCGAVDHEMWGIPADARGGQVRCVLGEWADYVVSSSLVAFLH